MRIDEFEFRNKQGEEIEPTKEQLVIYIKGLHKEIKELNMALELACDTAQFEDTCDYCRYEKEVGCPCYCETEQYFNRTQAIEYFKTKAKEMVKSE